MPRQNRVTPFGEIVASPERGTFMGNRGRLHDQSGRIRRAWQVKRWLVCALEFRGRKRVVMASDRYTELFFLDEASGLAAGHRPCAECRHGWYVAFRDAFIVGNPGVVQPGRSTADAIDARLHADRMDPEGRKRTYRTRLRELPDGVLVITNGAAPSVCLLWHGLLHAWTPSGYKRHTRIRTAEEVQVLTPRSTVQAIRAGYVPEVHSTAR
jgi:hypothetical protein